MERIRAAIEKARETRASTGEVREPALNGVRTPLRSGRRSASVDAAWAALEPFTPRIDLMAANRIITFDQKDNAHIQFDIMRTRLLSSCRQNGWTVVGITSPTAACGKTVAALNLAFSFSRQTDARTVLIDADLRLPAIAENLGCNPGHSMGRFLAGEASVEESFLAYGSTLAIGTNNRRTLHPAEILQSAAATNAMETLKRVLRPNVIIVDLPPCWLPTT